MQLSEQDSGITYGGLLALILSVALTLGATGTVGFYVARDIRTEPKSNPAPPTSELPSANPLAPTTTSQSVFPPGANGPFDVK
jgi:hypothetical protein